MSKNSKYSPTVPAVDQAIRLLNCLADSPTPQLTLTEICTKLDISKSKAYTILNTLQRYDFIEKNQQTKTYRLGLGIVSLSRNILNTRDIRDLVDPALKTLVNKTEMTAHYGQITGSRLYILAKAENDSLYGYSIRIGTHHHLTHGAHGKAIVAFLSEEERERVLNEEELAFYGDDEPVDLEQLKEELIEIRQTGFAIDPRETNPDIVVLSSPVLAGNNVIEGCIILIGSFSRSRIKEFGPLVAQTALKISKTLGYQHTRFQEARLR
jgi:DNA-binding IclR family transcriptional regulator